MPVFPTGLLTHSVTVRTRTTAITDGDPVESVSTAGTCNCLISSVSSTRGVNDQDGAIVWSATLSGTSALLSDPNVLFVVVKGPMPVGTVLFPTGGQSPHEGAGVRQFYRFPVSTVKPG